MLEAFSHLNDSVILHVIYPMWHLKGFKSELSQFRGWEAFLLTGKKGNKKEKKGVYKDC